MFLIATNRKKIHDTLWVLFFVVIVILFSQVKFVSAQDHQDDPQPTVTSTSQGAFVVVRPQEQDQINVRSGPSTTYQKVGVLLIGQQMSALGRSAGGDWIMIAYPGVEGGTAWVYAPLVSLSGGALPIIEPPPTPTLQFTQTVDPTLAARFVVTSAPTRMPTFTEAAPQAVPTFEDVTPSQIVTSVPMGLIIIILATAGIFLGLISIVQGR